MIYKKSIKNKKGSVLVFTLFIMMITLIIGISLMATSLSGRRSTISSGKSVNAFQIADSGLEATLNAIGSADLVNDTIGDAMSPLLCGDSEVQDNISGGEYTVTFWDNTDSQLGCIDDVTDISKVKSIGTYRNAIRSVETSLVFP